MRWINTDDYDLKCSKCGKRPLYSFNEEELDYYLCRSKYCPNCGAYMMEDYKMNDSISRQAAIDELNSLQKYSLIDSNDYLHGIGVRLKFAVQKLEQLPSAQPLTAYVISDEDGNIKCSNCGSSECWGNYCMDCGAKMDVVSEDDWEEPEINPCLGCDDYDGRGGCRSHGGCAMDEEDK